MEVANTINIQEPQIKRTSKIGQPLCNTVSVLISLLTLTKKGIVLGLHSTYILEKEAYLLLCWSQEFSHFR